MLRYGLARVDFQPDPRPQPDTEPRPRSAIESRYRSNYSNDTRNSSSSSSPGNTGRSPLALNAATPARMCVSVSGSTRHARPAVRARFTFERVERHAEIRVKVAFIPAPFESLGRRRHDDAWTHVYVVARHPHAEFRSQKILGFDRRSQEPGIPDVSGHHRRVERVLQVAFDAHMVQRVARLQLHTSAEPTEMPAVSDASEKRPRSDRSELVPIGARTRESLTRLFDDHESPMAWRTTAPRGLQTDDIVTCPLL